jgi:hypothetical protein
LAQCHIDTRLGFGCHWLKRSWWCQDVMVCSIPTITINGSLYHTRRNAAIYTISSLTSTCFHDLVLCFSLISHCITS